VYTFVETKLFTRLIDEYLSDEEFAALQLSLAESGSCDGPVAVGANVVEFE
jgi:hypothetical protein